MSTAEWSATGLSPTVFAASYSGRSFPLPPLNNNPGKLQLVKKLLNKLENLLRANVLAGGSNGKTGLIDMFLDTSLEEFTEHGEVMSRI